MDVKQLQMRAMCDDVESVYTLAKLYRNGPREVRDLNKAIAFLTRAANLNHAHACMDLAFLHLNGIKKEFQNYSEYLEYNSCYDKSERFVSDKATAMRLFIRAHDCGYVKKPEEYHPFEMAYLACTFSKDRNELAKELIDRLEKYANENLYASFVLGRCYDIGLGVKKNKQRAYELYKAPAKYGNMKAKNYLAWVCFNANEEGTVEDFVAADMFKDLVEKGFNNAYYGLGLCYYRGIGTYIDFDKALHTLKTGAKLGDADCCYQLGKFFMDGMLLEQDEELAEEYWLKGAEQKHTNCVRALAEYYYSQGSPEAILKSMHCHSILDRKGIESSKDWLCCYCSNNNITLHELNAKIRENPLGIQFTKSV